MKEEMRTRTDRAAPSLLSTQLPHQVEEDISKISPAMIGLGTVGSRRAHHVSEDPFVDIEVLEVEGRRASEKGTARRESVGVGPKGGETGSVCRNGYVCVCKSWETVADY